MGTRPIPAFIDRPSVRTDGKRISWHTAVNFQSRLLNVLKVIRTRTTRRIIHKPSKNGSRIRINRAIPLNVLLFRNIRSLAVALYGRTTVVLLHFDGDFWKTPRGKFRCQLNGRRLKKKKKKNDGCTCECVREIFRGPQSFHSNELRLRNGKQKLFQFEDYPTRGEGLGRRWTALFIVPCRWRIRSRGGKSCTTARLSRSRRFFSPNGHIFWLSVFENFFKRKVKFLDTESIMRAAVVCSYT